MTAVETAQARLDAAREADRAAVARKQEAEKRHPYGTTEAITEARKHRQETWADYQDALRELAAAEDEEAAR